MFGVQQEADLDERHERELAVLEAWLAGAELPEGTLTRELPWLFDLWTAASAHSREPGGVERAPQPGPAEGRPDRRRFVIYEDVVWSRGLGELALSDEDEGDPRGLPAGHLWGLTRDRQGVAIDCPCDNAWNVSFPTGWVLVEWTDHQRWERKLLEVTRWEQSQRYTAYAMLYELFPDLAQCWDVLAAGTIYLIPVTLDPKVLAQIDREQLTYARGVDPQNAGLQQIARRQAGLTGRPPEGEGA